MHNEPYLRGFPLTAITTGDVTRASWAAVRDRAWIWAVRWRLRGPDELADGPADLCPITAADHPRRVSDIRRNQPAST